MGITPWLLKVWTPSLAHVSVAAYVQDHTGGAVPTGISNWLRLYPPNDYVRECRHPVRVTKEEAASVSRRRMLRRTDGRSPSRKSDRV
jgi:hypothetical protein